MSDRVNTVDALPPSSSVPVTLADPPSSVDEVPVSLSAVVPFGNTKAVSIFKSMLSVSNVILSTVEPITLVLKLIFSKITLPVPDARNSKLLLVFVVVITLSNISISVELTIFSSSNSLLMFIVPAFNVPKDKSFVMLTLACGIIILPVPLARSSKSAFVEVVVITLSSNKTSSNCTD